MPHEQVGARDAVVVKPEETIVLTVDTQSRPNLPQNDACKIRMGALNTGTPFMGSIGCLVVDIMEDW